ncbi:MAG: 1,4-alpha-glucan branching enzyme [Solirubrobacterales bacterium]|nr:1,4-alpha-glucan branching enzyme [Solirubrobacterales bacterium]
MADENRGGDLAIVLHSHMPYVEGFGTYPFGEEWLFDAVARSYLPVLDVAEKITIGVTPVLADQLEAEGVGERMVAFLREHRLRAAEKDAAEAEGGLSAAAASEAAHYRAAIERLEALGGNALAAFQQAQGRVELIASAATHAVLPKLATREAQRLQVDAGLRSHRRRFGEPRGFWLPECGYRPGIEARLAERGLLYTCLDQSDSEEPLAALAPARTPGGPVAFTIDWPSVRLVWSKEGYPSHPDYAEYHRLSANGSRLWSVGGQPRDAEAAAERARAHAGEFLGSIAARLGEFSRARSRRGLVVFAIDTELLGHHWSEGPQWLAAVLEQAEASGVRLLTLSEALAEHEPEERELSESSWGEDKDLSTWDSAAVSDFAWGSRRLELRLLRGLDSGRVKGAAAERAARELLAVQASDWAFLDHRRQVGDYAYRRVTAHAEALLEAIESPRALDVDRARMRNLAPDLSLAPLFEP